MTNYSDIDYGAIILCNNETILCNTEDWLCDGTARLRQASYATTTPLPVGFYETKYSVVFRENEGWLLQENGYDILLEDGLYLLWERADALTATTALDTTQASTGYVDVSYS